MVAMTVQWQHLGQKLCTGKARGTVLEMEIWLWHTAVAYQKCWKVLLGPQLELNRVLQHFQAQC